MKRRRPAPPDLDSADAAGMGVLHAQAVLRAAPAETDEKLWLLASLETRSQVGSRTGSLSTSPDPSPRRSGLPHRPRSLRSRAGTSYAVSLSAWEPSAVTAGGLAPSRGA